MPCPHGIPDAVKCPACYTERLEAILETAWNALDGWSGDVELTRAEADALCDAWENLGNWKGWHQGKQCNEPKAETTPET